MEVVNGDKAKKDAAAKNVAAKTVSALGYGPKGGKNDLRKAVNSLKSAEKAFDHTQASIDKFKKVDPAGFNKANNLTYNDKNGHTHNLDISVSSGTVTDADKGQTTYGVNTGSGLITNNVLQTTIDMNVATDADVLAHELGHGVGIALDPVGYVRAFQSAAPDYDCQAPANSDNPLSKSALDMQHQYDSNLRVINKVMKVVSAFIPNR